MKAIQLSLIAVLSLALASCIQTAKENIPQKIDDFVISAQVHCKDYTQADWDKSVKEYEALMNEYGKRESTFTAEEKQKVANAAGRYHALLLENAIDQSSEEIKAIMQEIADQTKLLPAFMDGFKDVLQSDTVKLENIFSDIFASDPVKEIIGSIGSLFGGIGSALEGDNTEIETVVDTLGPAEPLDVAQ
ncbi:MAG: hypothetical protein IK041_01350 [Bacteroidales bacterium]|nr:hypothetical protein [Bacteroidales bacterium]